MMKSLLMVGGLLASSVSGHIQMSNPYPIRSPLNKNGSGQKDYSYTNPLSTDGSDYPCKGYAKDPFESQATYSPGGSYTMELQGSATHGGGSCQIALSYDSGESWKVIHTILGGCPIALKYDFTIPSDAQTGQALLGWSWFNKIGNREMYMNCAQVTIGGGGGGNNNREMSTALSRRDSFSSLPELFRANTGGPAGCKTIEGEEVNFPLPGPSVEGSLSGKGYECTGSAPFLGGGHSSKTSSDTASSAATPKVSSSVMASSSAAAAASSSPAAQSSGAASPAGSKVASAFGTSSVAHAQQTTAADAEVGCAHGTIVCGADGNTWSLCDNGRAVHMGNVAAGTQCMHGAMQRVS